MVEEDIIMHGAGLVAAIQPNTVVVHLMQARSPPATACKHHRVPSRHAGDRRSARHDQTWPQSRARQQGPKSSRVAGPADMKSRPSMLRARYAL